MAQKTRKWQNAVGIAVHAWADIGFVYAWLSGDAIVVGTYLVSSLQAMQAYAALAIGTGALLCFWNWDFYTGWRDERRARSPEAVFRRAHRIITREFNLIEKEAQYTSLARSAASKFAQRETLRFELWECGIGAPNPVSDSDQVWYQFVTEITPLSLHGRLQEARERWPL